jgi:hypothetical protein
MISVPFLISFVAKAPYPPFAERRASKYSVTNRGSSSTKLVEEEEKEDEEREGEVEEEEEEEEKEEGVRVGGVVIVWR